MLSKFSIYEEKQNLKKEDNLKPDEKKMLPVNGLYYAIYRLVSTASVQRA